MLVLQALVQVPQEPQFLSQELRFQMQVQRGEQLLLPELVRVQELLLPGQVLVEMLQWQLLLVPSLVLQWGHWLGLKSQSLRLVLPLVQGVPVLVQGVLLLVRLQLQQVPQCGPPWKLVGKVQVQMLLGCFRLRQWPQCEPPLTWVFPIQVKKNLDL